MAIATQSPTHPQPISFRNMKDRSYARRSDFAKSTINSSKVERLASCRAAPGEREFGRGRKAAFCRFLAPRRIDFLWSALNHAQVMPINRENSMKRILLVEDDPIVGMAYRRFLEAHGFTVVVATDGAAGIEQLADFKPNAVILDLMLPIVAGLDVLRVIRGQEASSSLPVLVLTNACVPLLVEQARAAGANRVFDKTNDKPLAIVGYLHDILRTTADAQLIPVTKSGNPDAVLEHWPERSSAAYN
jgi:CheY-like chemotaxis protein